jgi:hypothetical protein
MKPADFVKEPWKQASMHEAYSSSFLNMSPAPEYATGEVVLASTYRQVGFEQAAVTERKVPVNGRAFQKALSKGKRPRNEGGASSIEVDAWRRIVVGTLRSPKQPNQASKRFLQISPIVPDACLYSLSARLAGNPWNPGALVAKIIQFGEVSSDSVQDLWNRLFEALSVQQNDDIWARFLQQEFESWRTSPMKDAWSAPRTIEANDSATKWHGCSTSTPAERFTRDLSSILHLKTHLTRRQWVSLLEATLRLGTVSHVLWTCHANGECFENARKVLRGMSPPSLDQLKESFSPRQGFWRYGQLASATLTSSATEYARARAGINLLLHQLQEWHGPRSLGRCLDNLRSIHEWLQWLASIRETCDVGQFQSMYQGMIGTEARVVSGRSGISSNVKEFLRHVSGQRQTAEPGLDSYDQGYILAKAGSHRSARWSVSLGPVAVLAVVHGCTHGTRGPRTIDDFCRHLGEYGLEVESQEIPGSPLGQTLRNLGLVLDSPDAEGGMVIVNPFTLKASKAGDS